MLHRPFHSRGLGISPTSKMDTARQGRGGTFFQECGYAPYDDAQFQWAKKDLITEITGELEYTTIDVQFSDAGDDAAIYSIFLTA